MLKSRYKIIRSIVVSFMALVLFVSMSSSLIGETSAAEMVAPSISASFDTMDNILFEEDASSFSNPEIGWYKSYTSDHLWGLDLLKEQGIRVIQIKVDLKPFLTSPISEAKLREIRNAFTTAKKNGLQVIFRAAYDFTGLSSCEPKSLSIITGHIAQLKDIFFDFENILYCVQAGFLGPWGEWHSSYYGATPSLESRKTVLFALMDAVPASRPIQVRRPMFIRDIFADEPGGNIITESTAFNGSDLSRTGYHNDALLSTENESGTYVDPAFNRQAELEWLDNQGKYVPFGGESCFLGSNSDPMNAVSELDKLHAQFINIDYLPEVIQKWKSTSYEGTNTFDYITNHLGYRFVLVNAQVSSLVMKGGILRLNLNMKNIGFGNLTNARNFEIILSNGRSTYTAKINDDPRRWGKENGTMNKEMYFSIPSDIKTGVWSLYISLPNASEELRGNAAYSVRFANAGVWNEKSGYNLISNRLNIAYSTDSQQVSTFEQITKPEAERLTGVIS